MLLPEMEELISLGRPAQRLNLSFPLALHAARQGELRSPFRGQGLEFEEVRAYAPGDDIRSIDWKVTARTGAPHTKLYREERERTVLLCVDANEAMRFGTRGTFKSIQAARAAALLSWASHHAGYRVGGLVFGQGGKHSLLHPEWLTRSLWKLLKTLCEAPASAAAEIPLSSALHTLYAMRQHGALTAIISDFREPVEHWQSGLKRLAKVMNVVLLPVDDPADHTLPALGTVSFHHGGQMLTLNTNPAKGRVNYQRAWEERRQALLATCRTYGIPVIPLATNRDVFAELARNFGKRRR